MRDFITRVLDTINRPSDDIWVERIGEFYLTAWNRLQVKLEGAYNYNQIKVIFNDKVPAYDRVWLRAPEIKGFYSGTYRPLVITSTEDFSFTKLVDKSLIYSEATHKYYTIRNLEETLQNFELNSIPADWVLEKDGFLYIKDTCNDKTSTYHLFTKNLHLYKYTENFRDYVDLSLIADDYLYYEVCMKALLFLNEDLDRVSTFKALRDEAFLDVQNHVQHLHDHGTISIKG